MSVLMWGISFAYAQQSVVVVVGAAGNDEYSLQFLTWAGQWEQAATEGKADFTIIGGDSEPQIHDRQRLFDFLKQEPSGGSDPLWVVLIGHGTFDGRMAKFNLRGPDVSAAELAEALNSFTRPLALINCASASAPFINQLSGSNRVIVTSTKSGFQYNYARFGRYLADAILDPAADLDKDEQTSLLEAFLLAAAGVREFYESEGRLTTEDGLIDDNGDGLGTPAEWFRGVRTTRSAEDGAPVDGLRANQFVLVQSTSEQQLSADQRQRRDALEAELAALRDQKRDIPHPAYYDQLEVIVTELANLYAADPTPKEESQPPSGSTADGH